MHLDVEFAGLVVEAAVGLDVELIGLGVCPGCEIVSRYFVEAVVGFHCSQ